jgi:hypothetical protein
MKYERMALAACIIAAQLGPRGSPALANDSSAELSVGGLVFKHTSDVAIESEDLWVSPDEIVVRYRFRNQTSTPVKLTVAFPLPDIDLSEAANLAVPTSDPVNFVGFQTKVDGKSVGFQMVQRAYLGGTDVSAKVKEAGLPLSPFGTDQDRFNKLPEPVRTRLLDEGLIIPTGSDERGRDLYGGAWVVKTSVLREQVFPAGRSVAVEHRYKASVGMSFDTVLRKALRESRGMKAEFERYRKDYCISDELLKSIDGLAGNAPSNTAHLQERRISYVLTTGANWAGPIRDFHLVIDKGQPDRLASFCADKVNKLSATAVEVRLKDFTPTRDLKILIIGRR